MAKKFFIKNAIQWLWGLSDISLNEKATDGQNNTSKDLLLNLLIFDISALTSQFLSELEFANLSVTPKDIR